MHSPGQKIGRFRIEASRYGLVGIELATSTQRSGIFFKKKPPFNSLKKPT
jgi:hypothetical protein